MSRLDPDQVLDLFDRGRILGEERRGAFLDGIVDPAMRSEVSSLLQAAARTPRFLERQARRGPGLRPGSEVAGYRILEPLGRGGQGHVYRARRGATGRDVAIKTVGELGEQHAGSIRREIATLAGLRHPGIARILDHGVHEAVPWYAMALEEGPTLGQFMAGKAGAGKTAQLGQIQVPRHGISLRRARGRRGAREEAGTAPAPRAKALLLVARRLCAPLAYLHGEGVVHRDLKPGNVIVRADGTPVLVDFGIVARTTGRHGREALEVFAGMAGTAHYVAPEQVQGDLVDARADLYALGCILYEMVTGAPPFAAQDVAEILGHHLETRPAPPSSLAQGVPPALDALILRLLAKAPGDRIGYAEDVAAALDEAGVVDPSRPSLPRPRTYLYRSRLEGRDGAMAGLAARVAKLSKGEGGSILVSGESGIGKTRLCLAVGRDAWTAGNRVLVGACSARSSRRGAADARERALHALEPLFRLVADRCRREGPREIAALLGSQSAVLAAHVPLLAELPELGVLDPPAPLPEAAARARLVTAVRDVVHRLAARERILLILDDLQWADELTMDLLTLLSRSPRAGVPLLVVGTYRTDELTPALAALQESCVEVLRLGSIDAGGVSGMVRSMLASPLVPEGFVDFLASRSGGNPFHVAEYLRLAVDRGVLSRTGGRWSLASGDRRYERLALPRNVRDLVDSRLDRLGDAARALASGLAVLGSEADAALVERIVAVPDAARLAAWGELLSAAVAEDAGDGRYRFAHDRYREVAYARLPHQARRRLHRRAANAICARDVAPSAELGLLALHCERAGRPRQARRWYGQAARRAVAELLVDDAEAMARACLRLARAPDRETLSIRLLLADDVLRPRAQLREALREAGRAQRLAASIGARRVEAHAWMSRGHAELPLGRTRSASRSYRRALAISTEERDRRGRHRAMANLLLTIPDLRRQRLLAAAALRLARASRDVPAQVQCRGELARIAAQLGDADEAGRLYGDALEACAGADPPGSLDRFRSILVLNRAILRKGQGRIGEANAGYEEAQAWARRAGDVVLEATALSNLGVTLLEQGRLAEARHLYERERAILEGAGEKRERALVLFNLACVAEQEGDEEAAAGLFEDSLALFDVTGLLGGRQAAHAHLGALAWRAGDVGAARAHHDRGLAIGGGDAGCEGLILLSRARLLRCEGRLDEADAACASAERLLEGSAFELGVCICERSFLELARGRDASGLHARAFSTLERIEAGPRSRFGQAFAALGRALEAKRAGKRLLHGQVASDLPPWVAERARAQVGAGAQAVRSRAPK